MHLISQHKTMTSLEIAELVGTEHRNVKVSIERLMKNNIIGDSPLTNFEKINNLGFKTNIGVYVFSGEKGKRDSIVIVAQLSPSFTAALVDRWNELERENAQNIPQTFAQALQLAANQALQLELQAPKVDFYDELADRTNLMNASQLAQKIKMSAITLNKHLNSFGVYNESINRARVFKHWFIEKGYGELKETSQGYSQAMFTTKGEQWVFKKLKQQGII